MLCPICEGPVDVTLFNVERNAEEDGAEINFNCPWCRKMLFAELTSADFVEVD